MNQHRVVFKILPTVSGASFVVTNAMTARAQFFRLKR